MDTVTLSVVSHGQSALVAELLRDLARLSSDRVDRIVVTLNLDEPFDPSSFAVRDVVVIRNAQPRGFGANHNAAFAHCRSKWFAVLNPDLRLGRSDAFAQLIDAATALRAVGVIAPRIVGPSGQDEDSVRPNLTPWSLLQRRLRPTRQVDAVRSSQTRVGQPFFWLAGMFLLVDTHAYREVGGFDERYFLYCEDYDLCARLYAAGRTLAVDRSVRVVHEARRASHRSARYMAWHLQSLARVWLSRAFWTVTLRSPRARNAA